MDKTIISMKKSNRFGGTWGSNVPFAIDTNSDDYKAAVATMNKSSDSKDGGNIWDKIFKNAGGWISSISGGIASIVQAKNGNYPTYQQDNTPKVLAIAGVGAVVLIIILVIIFKK